MNEALRIGMQYAVAAPISTEVEGQAITYGSGFRVGNAVSASITWNRTDNSHYGDDAEDARDNGVTSGDIEFTNSGILATARAALLGESKVGSTDEYEMSVDATPSVGFGYVRVIRKSGVIVYEGVWLHKVQFAENTVNDNTKGETIEWGETVLNGRIFAVKDNAQMVQHIMAHQEFATLSAAIAYLNGKANIAASA